MGKVLIDTCVLINIQRNDRQTIEAYGSLPFESVYISVITGCELMYGSRDAAEKKKNMKVFDSLYIWQVNEGISKLAFELIKRYGLKQRLSISDALIASTAIIYEVPLWTLNRKHFEGIDALELWR